MRQSAENANNELVANNDIMQVEINANTEIAMEVDKDDRALEDVIMHQQLTAMGLQSNIVEERIMSPTTKKDLKNILQNEEDSKESYTLITDNNILTHTVLIVIVYLENAL